ncbi:MAG: histidine-type phosphatase [Bacteroidales bacterium]|nr:histidine-type phosphatase [Bacteroidales bacterium]
MKKISLILAVLLLVSCQKGNHYLDNTGYILEDEVVFSRHNIRSPLSAPGSELSIVTPYDWVDWGVETAHLTARGGRIEQKMGNWFREDLDIFESLNENNTLIYSNSKQRTIKTAENFIAGFNKDLPLFYLYQDDSMDPLFNPMYTVMNDDLQKRIIADMNEIGGVAGTEDDPYKGILAAVENISDDIRFMEDVIGFKDSPYAEENQLEHLPLDEMTIILTEGEEPAMKGDYKLVNSIADAVVLQYYETGKAFGKDISFDDIRRIGKVKTVYDKVLFANHTTAVLVSNPLVKKIKDEICDSARKFTFLCGHDSNIASITAALGMRLPQTIDAVEFASPIGSKIVLQKYKKGDSEFIKVNLIYASVSQLRETQEITISNPPMILPIDFDGLSRNADGYYKMEDVINRFDETIAEFESLAK